MVQKAGYKCLTCGDEFEYKHHCILHSMEWKHDTFEMLGTDIQIVIKP
jgi:hypothetical protein